MVDLFVFWKHAAADVVQICISVTNPTVNTQCRAAGKTRAHIPKTVRNRGKETWKKGNIRRRGLPGQERRPVDPFDVRRLRLACQTAQQYNQSRTSTSIKHVKVQVKVRRI